MSLPCKINPLGYTPPLPALFLESTGGQYCVLNYTAGPGDDIDFGLKLSSGTQQVTGSGTEGYRFIITQYSASKLRLSAAGRTWGISDFEGLGTRTQVNAFMYADGTFGVDTKIETYEPYAVVEYPHTQYLGSHKARGGFTGRYYYFNVTNNGARKFNATPALDRHGKPCLVDNVTKRPFYNSSTGAFIVGMTAAQARQLGKLPPGGGSLTVSLPAAIVDGETVTDATVQAALDAAAAKGWTITIQTYTE